MAAPRLVVLLVAGVLLIPGAFVMSRVAAGSDREPRPPPAPTKATGKGGTPPFKPGVGRGRPAKAPVAPAKDPVREARKKAGAAGVPAAMAVALAKRQTVVLLLSDGKSADDRSTGRAVRGLRGRAPKTKIFTDRLRNLPSYRGIVGQVGVSQSPAVVIVKGSEARVVEGYVDRATLLQQVLDTRR